MNDGPLFAASVGGVAIGLAVLLLAEATHVDPLVYGGGVLALASVGLLTYAVAWTGGDASADHA